MEKDFTLQNAIAEMEHQVDKLLAMQETDAEYEATVSKVKDLQNTIGAELEKLFGKESVYTSGRYGTTAEDREKL